MSPVSKASMARRSLSSVGPLSQSQVATLLTCLRATCLAQLETFLILNELLLFVCIFLHSSFLSYLLNKNIFNSPSVFVI